MKAVAVFPGRRSIEIIEHPEPARIASDQVALRMLEVGICGTDREIASMRYGEPPRGSPYLVIGHESLAEVVALGSAVSGLREKDLVVLQVRRPCPHERCLPCRTGHPDFCITGDFAERGIVRAHGYMTEIVTESAAYVHRVPERLREVSVLVEPLSIAEKALGELWHMDRRFPWRAGVSGLRALVLGAGPVGLLGAMALSIQGADVTVYSREQAPDPKVTIVAMLGGTYVSSQDAAPELLFREHGPFDVVYEATGAASLSFRIIESLHPNATFIFTGVPGQKDPVSLDAALIMRKIVLENQVIFGSVNAGYAHFEKAIEHLGSAKARWPDAVSQLITARHSLAEAPEFLTSAHGGIKHVISIGVG